MNCKDNLSCTFLDVFFFIVDKTHFNKIKNYEQYKINPNTYLKISTLNDGYFLIKFTQTYLDSEVDSEYYNGNIIIHIGCWLELFLQYKNDKIHLVEKAYRNYKRHQVTREKNS